MIDGRFQGTLRIGLRAADELLNLIRCRRQSNEVEIEPSDEGLWIRIGDHCNLILFLRGTNETVDVREWPRLFFHHGQLWFDRPLKRPKSAPLFDVDSRR